MRRRRLFAINGAVLTVGLLGAALLVTGQPIPAHARPAPEDTVGAGPAIAVTAQPDRYDVYPGDTVTVLVTVVNTGTAPLVDGLLSSSLDGISMGLATPDGCEHQRIEPLAPGRSARYACSVEAPAAIFQFGATVTARSVRGRTVRDTVALAVGGTKAALSVSVTGPAWPLRPGEEMPLHVSVRNDGQLPLSRISTIDSTVPACSQEDLGTLAPGQERGYGCTGSAPPDDASTVVLARGMANDQPEVRAVSRAVTVDVVHPALVVSGTRSRHGSTVTVTNVGDTALREVRTRGESRCARPALGELAPGESATYRCAAGDGMLTAVGTPDVVVDPGRVEPLRSDLDKPDAHVRPASATSQEVQDAVDLGAAGHASLTVTQRASRVEAQAGATVRYAITVRNTGSVALRSVMLRDPLFAACDGVSLGGLAPRRRARFTCTVAAPAEDITHVAVATGQPDGEPATGQPDGPPPVSAVSRPAELDIVHPALAVTLVAEPADPYPREPVDWVLTVANIGDVPVRGVTARSIFGECDRRIGTLRAEDTPVGLRCTVAVGSSAVTNVVTISGRLASGDVVTEIVSAIAHVRASSGPGGRGVGAQPVVPVQTAEPPPEGEAVPPSADQPPLDPQPLSGGPGTPASTEP